MVRRLLSVYRTIRRHRLDTLLPEDRRPWMVQTLFALSRLPTSEPLEGRGTRLRQALQELGPVLLNLVSYYRPVATCCLMISPMNWLYCKIKSRLSLRQRR